MSTYLTLTGRVIVVLFDVADMVPLSWDNWINATVSAKFEYYKKKVASKNPDPRTERGSWLSSGVETRWSRRGDACRKWN